MKRFSIAPEDSDRFLACSFYLCSLNQSAVRQLPMLPYCSRTERVLSDYEFF